MLKYPGFYLDEAKQELIKRLTARYYGIMDYRQRGTPHSPEGDEGGKPSAFWDYRQYTQRYFYTCVIHITGWIH
jgi:hypothetical protein